MTITSKPSSPDYRRGYERIFGHARHIGERITWLKLRIAEVNAGAEQPARYADWLRELAVPEAHA